METSYLETYLDISIKIENIVTIHSYKFDNGYLFKGEKHDFWELVYVENGEVEIMAGIQGYKLQKGDIVFHKPNEFHGVWANGKISPKIIVVSFKCYSEAMKFFETKILKLSSSTKDILNKIVSTASEAFSNNLSIDYRQLYRKKNNCFGSEQLIKIYSELLLILIEREHISNINIDRLSFSTKEKIEADIINNVTAFMYENIEKEISFDEICSAFYMGHTHLKTIFKASTGYGVVAYFNRLKIEEAKKMIKAGNYNITEISEKLGFNSIHYFSRSFKRHTGVPPTYYSKSI